MGALLLMNYHEAVQQFATEVTEGESNRFVIPALRHVFALRREAGSWIPRTVLVTDCGPFVHSRC
jgi:hypothetical protein